MNKMDYEKKIEIPFGAMDSELKGWEYTIPEGMEAVIENGKVIVRQRESEDEKIRNDIMEAVENWFPYERVEGIRYYLDKQKEQKPLMSDGEIEDKKRDIVSAIRKYYPADYATYLTSFLRGLSPEDNSDDEYGQEMLGIAYKLMYEHIPENLRTQEFWDSLKFMREYTGKVAIIPSYEHPAEWSEEDEKILNSILNDIRQRVIPDEEDMEWLKSLPERTVLRPKQEKKRMI